MTQDQPNPDSERKTQSSQDAWQEVGRQVQTLGDSLANAFRTAWQDEENRQRLEEMRSGVESMVSEVGQVLRDYAASPEGEQVKSDVKKAAENLKSAGEQTMTEVRPHLLSALRQVNSELQRMIDRMENPEQK